MDTFVLSNFDTHILLSKDTADDSFVSSAVIGGSSDTYVEVDNVINFQSGEINKDTKTYRTLTNDGWESIAVLGQSIGDHTISCIRPADGIYQGEGDTGTTNYEILRKWFMDSLGANNFKARRKLIVISPRLASQGASTISYEATEYNVIPKTFKEGDKDPDAGQEFEITVGAFGRPFSASATKSVATNVTTWSFEKTDPST